MRADTYDLAAIFGRPVNYLVPLYQRPYVWTREKQWEPLWEDVRDVADRQLDHSSANDTIPHFLGAIVLERSLLERGLLDGRTIIDGQQRLTTLQLLIAAARSIAVDRGFDSLRRQFEPLLLNDKDVVRGDGDPFKVTPTQQDRAPFREVLGGGIVASTGSHRMHQAYRYFRGEIAAWLDEVQSADEASMRLEKLGTVIWKRLIVVQIDLGAGDNAQAIFETMNALGTPLLAADLIKNHLFQTATLQGADIAELYEQHWKVFESAGAGDEGWWRETVQQGRLTRPRLDVFLNHWLAMTGDEDVVSNQLFAAFKRYLADGPRLAADVLADMERYAHVYERFEKEPPGTELGRFLYRLNTMEVTTAYPALLWLLGPDGLADSEIVPALRSIESWLVRRMLIRGTTKNYNNVFLALLRHVRGLAEERGSGPVAGDVTSFLAGLTGESQAWPRAADVRSALLTLPAYTVFQRPRLRMVLEALEAGKYTGLTEKVSVDTGLTIEHVLPQEWSTNWPLPPGADPVQAALDRDAAKHRLGNLTLVTKKLNPTMSNDPWAKKRDHLRERSVLLISADIRAAETWDEEAIAERGRHLADLAQAVWMRPDDVAVGVDAGGQGPGMAAASAAQAGPPDPDNPSAFVSVLTIADQAGVGDPLRQLIAVSRELGLWPKPDKYSVMVAPPADHRVYLFTVWPQADDGGSFRIWKSPTAFARWLPGVTLAAARAAIGASEEPGVLPGSETDAFLTALRGLVPSRDDEAFEERKATLLALDIAGVNGVPGSVLRLIDHRAGGRPEVAVRFAAGALACDGVALRPQQSKWDPWYFQVRHSRFRQVVAYAHPRPGEIRVEYRLPGTHDTYGVATARDNYYGIVFTATDDDGVEVALQLLRDALARTD